MDKTTIQNAIAQLSKSYEGRETIRAMYNWLSDVECYLDIENQIAVETILEAVWGGLSRTIIELLGDACRYNERSEQ